MAIVKLYKLNVIYSLMPLFALPLLLTHPLKNAHGKTIYAEIGIAAMHQKLPSLKHHVNYSILIVLSKEKDA